MVQNIVPMREFHSMNLILVSLCLVFWVSESFHYLFGVLGDGPG